MAEKYSDLNPRSKAEQALLLADHLPQGRLWAKAYDATSTIGLLTQALSVEFYQLEVLQRNVAAEWTIDTTVKWIEDWEASVGLPSSCIPIPATIEDRRELVRAMLTNFGGLQTKEDYERAGALLGFDVTVIPGGTEGATKADKNTIIIEVSGAYGGSPGFPAPFPMTFGAQVPAVVQCFYEAIAPATDAVVVRPA